MEFVRQAIPDVVLLKPVVHRDSRGFFLETFRQAEFEEHCGQFSFIQENHSGSARGVLRGLHLQLGQPQGKLVRVVQGKVYDVAVDMRAGSSMFGQWVAAELSAQNCHQLWVPPGFAHGFYVLSERAEVAYKCTDYYAPGAERTLAWNDPDLMIDWPLQTGNAPALSEKDSKGQSLGALAAVLSHGLS